MFLLLLKAIHSSAQVSYTITLIKNPNLMVSYSEANTIFNDFLRFEVCHIHTIYKGENLFWIFCLFPSPKPNFYEGAVATASLEFLLRNFLPYQADKNAQPIWSPWGSQKLLFAAKLTTVKTWGLKLSCSSSTHLHLFIYLTWARYPIKC